MTDCNIDEVIKTIFDHEDPNWKPLDKIPLIVKEIEVHKHELKTFLASSDYNMIDIIRESEELSSDSRSLVNDLDMCKKEIEEETMAEIVKSIESYDTLSKELQSVIFATKLIGDVIQCGRYVKEFEDGREAHSFTRSMEAVCDLVQYLELPTEGFDYLDIAAKTKETSQHILDNLVQELFAEWTRLINWTVSASTRKTVVHINLIIDESKSCLDLLNALVRCKKLSVKIDELAEFIFNSVLKPMLNNECSVYCEGNETVVVTMSHKQNYKPTYDTVISNYKLLFDFLSMKLNIDIKHGVTIFMMLGNKLSTDFADTIIENCLIDTIPNNIQELQSYARTTTEIEDFQKFLVTIKFFPDDNSISILDYLTDIDVLFANKASKHLLEKARTIMMKDLSDSMSIGVTSIPDDTASSNDTDQALDIFDKAYPKNLFYFPRCMISKSAQELLDLLYMVMEEAVQCQDAVCRKLYNTSRLIFELYEAVVPYHHENYLQTIPQYVALFHNNCMYLAHNMQTFGDKWVGLLEGRSADSPLGFLDLVHKLRRLAAAHLAAHMQHQRKQILDNIRSSDLNSIVVKDVLGDNAEAAVRQCLRQLQILKNVWIGVFPYNVFTRLMGTLVNMLVEELTHRVCSAEDISMEMATQLTQIYTLVIKKAPQLFQVEGVFQNGEDIGQHVKCWAKLAELVLVLGGSLKDIESRWAGGAGPLAGAFRAHELRGLVKALFQNTQIRANLLSKIK